jgi:hypothetical protein
VGEPTCLRQSPLSFRLICLMESGLGLINSLYPLRELLGVG